MREQTIPQQIGNREPPKVQRLSVKNHVALLQLLRQRDETLPPNLQFDGLSSLVASSNMAKGRARIYRYRQAREGRHTGLRLLEKTLLQAELVLPSWRLKRFITSLSIPLPGRRIATPRQTDYQAITRGGKCFLQCSVR
jgi:hypothetical protein